MKAIAAIAKAPRVVMSRITAVLLMLGMALPSLGFWMSRSEAKAEAHIAQQEAASARREAIAARREADSAGEAIQESSDQIASLLEAQGRSQRIAACRTDLARSVDIAMLEYLRASLGEPVPRESLLANLQVALKAREDTEEICGL